MESTENMELEKVTEKNIDFAVEIQEELFPGESGRANFEESIYGSAGFEYFLLYENGTCVGIIGIYSYPEDPKSAWLGWFGIRKEFRRETSWLRSSGNGSRTWQPKEDIAIPACIRMQKTTIRQSPSIRSTGMPVNLIRTRTTLPVWNIKC